MLVTNTYPETTTEEEFEKLAMYASRLLSGILREQGKNDIIQTDNAVCCVR